MVLALAALPRHAWAADRAIAQLDSRFSSTVQPFLKTYCFTCHGGEKTEAEFDLTTYWSRAAVVKDGRRWALLLERLETGEMPPEKAKLHPPPEARRQMVDWLRAVRDYETNRNAGDPGIVLARRLSNAEYNYTIRDLTGVDIRPAREFPVDPSNTAGFDNSGESLAMSPALLKKYLAAARGVADQMFLQPKGFAFAPHPMVTDSDRDKYCVHQIVDFYHRQNTDYADYFQAAWRFKHRVALGKPQATLADFATERKVSAKYLATIWAALEGAREEVGPLVKLQSMWQELPAPGAVQPEVARKGCEQLRAYVIQLRKKVEPRFLNRTVGNIGALRQPLLVWKNVQYATHRRSFDPAQLQVAGEVRPVEPEVPEPAASDPLGPGRTRLIKNTPGDPDLVVPAGERARYEAAFGRFCRVFPDMFYMEERGRSYFNTTQDRGRYLSAGFHNVMGYFRDDQPLYELLLNDKQQKELDEMWRDLDFVAAANIRTYVEYAIDGSKELRAIRGDVEGVELVTEVKQVTSEARIKWLAEKHVAYARGGSDGKSKAVEDDYFKVGVKALEDFFQQANAGIRWVEKARTAAEPSHLDALLQFAARAYRRPLQRDEKAELLAYYRTAREQGGFDHETAIRESIVSVLMSPELCYRIDFAGGARGIHPLSDYDLASRLSYFLWSSLPDDELLARAAAGDLHQPKIIAAQARRMLKDSRTRALAVEFGANWLDFRRFEELGTVDRERFPAFTGELRQAMFEEPIRFMLDVFQANRPIPDFLYANDTFVNPILAKHYGIPLADSGADEWVRIADAGRYQRGGLLPMAVFLTKNAPGLRTSPVKRGNWVVKNILGERIPPPPPVVPELPRDEAKLDLPLRDMLARHRADASCAACHVRFDSLGLVFEGFGPVGERREKDLAGRSVDASATFPGGSEGTGLEGLQRYIHDRREKDFVENFCGKLLAYALGRSLMFSDDVLIREMRAGLAANGNRFDTAIERIVTSPQFLTKRGRDDFAER